MIFANRPEGNTYLRNFVAFAHACGWRGAMQPTDDPFVMVENDNDHTDRTVCLISERNGQFQDYQLKMWVRVWVGNGADLRSDTYEAPTNMPWTALLMLPTDELVEQLKHPQLMI